MGDGKCGEVAKFRMERALRTVVSCTPDAFTFEVLLDASEARGLRGPEPVLDAALHSRRGACGRSVEKEAHKRVSASIRDSAIQRVHSADTSCSTC